MTNTATPSRALCRHCGAAPSGCDALHLLGGRRCCTNCAGNHEAPPTERNHHR